MCTSARLPPLPEMVQYQLVIISDVSSPTTNAPPAIFNLGKNGSFSDAVYIEPAESITANYF